jgi:VWFA-related protein
VVLADAVVTNKKGEFIHGLSQKDLKILEDSREQTITSFSFIRSRPCFARERSASLPHVLFDNATIDLPHQQPIRDAAAAQFVAANAGPRRLMSVVEYGPGIRIAQDFTGDGERLKQAIGGSKLAHLVESGYDARGAVFALESMAKRWGKCRDAKA